MHSIVAYAPNRDLGRWLNNMKLNIILAFAAGAVAAFFIGALHPRQPTTADHWATVREYRAYVLDPENYSPDPTTGLLATTPPIAPQSSLAALVFAHELAFIDMVLPTVSATNRAANRLWMNFCAENDGIMYATGNPSYVAFPTEGQEPLHLNIWYEKRAEADVQKLIKTLDEITSQD